MSKHLVVAVALAALVSSSVFAADMPLKAPPAPIAPTWSWTSFYVGGNVGYGWGNETGNWSALGIDTIGDPCSTPGGASLCPATTTSNKLNGALGGLQAGYNWQIGTYLAGIETDIQYSGQKGNASVSSAITFPGFGGPVTVPFSGTSSERLDWFGTLRGRLGVTSDRWLIYATGGLAYGEVRTQGAVNATGVPFGSFPLVCLTVAGCPFQPFASWSSDQTKIGWTAGAGVERNLDAHWSIKAEYLFVDLGHANSAFATVPGCFGNGNVFAAECSNIPSRTGLFSTLAASSLVRFGLNYHL
jgi:outer membrane immunogenic protein